MTPKEQPYKDKEITIRDRETVKLSELTKKDRDIFFAGVEEGSTGAGNRAAVAIVLVLVVIAIVSIIHHFLK